MRSVIPFFIIGICIGMYFVYISPTISDIKVKNIKKSEYENVISKVQEIKKMRETLSTRYNNITPENMDMLNKIIPEKFDSVVFAHNLNSMSSKYGMLIRDVKVNYSAPRGDVAEAQIAEKNYKTISAKVRLSGKYDQFLSFLKDLESSLGLMDVVDLNVRTLSNRRGEEANLDYNLEIHTYALQ